MVWSLSVDMLPRKNTVLNYKTPNEATEQGIVTAVFGNEAIIELSEQKSCSSCGARMICMPDNSGKRQVRAANPHRAAVGRQVAIHEKSNFLLMISFLQYGVPLLFFFLFTMAFYLADATLGSLPKELVWFSGGLIGIMCGAFLSRYFIDRLAATGKSFFEISEILI